MEDTLRVAVRKSKVVSVFVLILVLMEDTLREKEALNNLTLVGRS